MRSIRLPSWIEGVIGLDGRLVPGHIFMMDGSALRYVHLQANGGGAAGRKFSVVDHQSVELAEETFHDGLLGGPPRDRGSFQDVIARFVDRLAVKPAVASLVLPDAWLRLSFVETAELPQKREARDEALRWKLKRLVPFRVDELRIGDTPVAPLPHQQEERRVLIGFAIDSLVRQLEEAFAASGVRLGLISNSSLCLTAALKFAVGDAALAAQCLVSSDGYSLTFIRKGEPILHRYKPIAAEVQPDAYASLVARDLRLTRSFLTEQFENETLDRAVLVAPQEAEDWWREALEKSLEVEPLTASWELLPFEGDMPLFPWEDLAAMFGAACREIA